MTYVRYLVTDVQKAVDFYSTHLGFTVKQQFPAMAIAPNRPANPDARGLPGPLCFSYCYEPEREAISHGLP